MKRRANRTMSCVPKKGEDGSAKLNRSVLLFVFFLLMCLVLAVAAWAEDESWKAEGRDYNPDLDYAQVEDVKMERESSGRWTVRVTVRHADSGWDHYADKWQLVDPESGDVLATRVLAHPHVNEQPFTRSLSGVELPEAIETVLVRAGCNLHGFEGRQILVDPDKHAGH